MVNPTYEKAILLLEDGTFYEGKACGKKGTTSGEICFNTGMTGYQEIFTDPSYYGQVLVATNAHIGNYGTSTKDIESNRVQIAGLVCKNFTNDYSRQAADLDLQQYFEDEGVVGISDVDTRSIVRYIRDKGAMNAIISSVVLDKDELMKELKKVPSMDGLELASVVSTKEPYFVGTPDDEKRIAVLDYGTKVKILDCFTERGCYLKVFNAITPFEELEKWNPDGYFLSNGPGDPAAMDYAIETVKKILEKDKPVFGICLGHQILALAMDIPTYKMHHGHRGINHPVLNLISTKGEITSQNHGFGVNAEELEKRSDDILITHKNLNDNTIEGMKIKGKKAFSVQYHPEAAPGPHDSRYLFDEFVSLL
ncbi:glutamine-hydrolyzing carbamoyl-phosphate synthase small subunit [Portibacter lacus]|uniref:Carbamoyl phosphate synthase small chain n=1 Tax=Portibacter lacus TaxID=1099794 RepID=A0AA37SUJ5_9BACT|nr:glutamine-hydrolyzing carbamoyl-phosphate synthase small subunit [Portibacter lacus]GLR19345.1 carbamoyl-phosphate synthase small chain [Portibacter lacus]